jgi:hypothetical protein
MSTTKHATVELLDNGQFIITRPGEQKIKGRFTMAAFDRFCTLKEIKSFIDLLKRITVGMSIGDYADLMLMAFQDYYRTAPEQCPVNKQVVLDMIDELGGLGNEFFKIIFHAIGRVSGGGDIKLSEAKKKASPADSIMKEKGMRKKS